MTAPRIDASGSDAAGAIDWEGALREHASWLRRVIYARVGPGAVDDVWQELALAAVKQQAPLERREAIGPWLYRLAVRQALLYRRKLGRGRKLVNRFAANGVGSEESRDPLDWLLAIERRQLVREALEHITAREAEVLLLKYGQDWSYREIADHVGMSVSAVEARLFRARRRLRARLASLEPAGA